MQGCPTLPPLSWMMTIVAMMITDPASISKHALRKQPITCGMRHGNASVAKPTYDNREQSPYLDILWWNRDVMYMFYFPMLHLQFIFPLLKISTLDSPV